MSDTNKLSLAQIDKLVGDLENAGAAGYSQIDGIFYCPIQVLSQLADTMRENEQLKKAVLIADEWQNTSGSKLTSDYVSHVLFDAAQPYKDSNNGK